MAAGDRAPDRGHRSTAVKGALSHLPTDFPQFLALPFVRAGEVLQFCAGFAPREARLDKTQWIRVKFAHAVDQLQRFGRIFCGGGYDSVGDHGQGSPFASAAFFSSTSCCRPAFNRALARATGTLPGASHVVWNIPISMPNSSSALFATPPW